MFSREFIKSTVKDYSTIEALADDKFKLKPNVTISGDSYTCPDETNTKKPTIIYVNISSNWLIFSDDLTQIDSLLSRMANKDKAEIDLKSWREYRRGKLASIALYNPEYIGKSIGGMSGYIAGGVYKKNSEVSAIYSSVDLSYLTPGIHLNSQVQANNDWAKKYALEGKTQIAQTKLATEDYSPTFANLLNTLQVTNDDNSLIIDFVVTQDDIEKIPEAMSEIFSSFFSFGSGSKDGKEDITAESINETPWDYVNNKKLGSSAAFKAGTFSGIPSLIDGPFAVNMEKVSIGEKSGLVELDIKALMSIEKIKGFWSNSKAKLSLTIDSVLAANQQELLKDERCDKKLPMFATKNQQAVEGFNTDSDHAYVSKTIRLISDAKFSQVKQVNGSLRFNAPINVSLVDIDFQESNGFKDSALEFMITKAQQQTVTYKMKGKTDNVLEVRALNKKGQVLNFSHSFGNEDSMTASYRGDIAKLQLVIANKWLDKEIDFTLNSEDFLKGKPHQQYKINQFPQSANKKNIKTFSKVNLAELSAEKVKKISYISGEFVGSTEINPVKILLSHDYKSSWSFQPKLHLVMPLIEPLAFNLQAVEVEIEQEAPFKTFVNAFVGHVINKDKSIGKYNGQLKVGEFKYLHKQVDLKLPIESGQKLLQLKGQYIYHLPKRVQQIDLAFPELGQLVDVGGVELRLIAIKTGFMANYTFEVAGDDLINVIATTDQGNFYPNQQRYKEGKWQLEFALLPNIQSLKVLVAKEKEQVISPFVIKLNYE